jgi:hypothetical protein
VVGCGRAFLGRETSQPWAATVFPVGVATAGRRVIQAPMYGESLMKHDKRHLITLIDALRPTAREVGAGGAFVFNASTIFRARG